MKLLAKIIVAVLANAAGLWAATTYIPGFELSGGWKQIFMLALIFTALNFILKPILKLIFGPVIILTLGAGLIFVNILLLFVLDKISQNLTIVGIPALIYGTILIGLINFIFHLIP